MAKDEHRPDIQAAINRMEGKLGAGRELKKLPEHLAGDETVEQLATGMYGKGMGLLVMTNRRLLFVLEGVMAKMSEDFPYSKISSIQWSSGMVMGSIVVHASGVKSEITHVTKQTGKQIVDAVREKISGTGSAPAAVPAPAAATSSVDELVKLAGLHQQGVLSDNEFVAAKKTLLGM